MFSDCSMGPDTLAGRSPCSLVSRSPCKRFPTECDLMSEQRLKLGFS
jgi:hypothetical protein